MIVLCAFVFLLVDANSQTIPYMTFMGQTLPNNSYVDVSLVTDPLSTGGEGVQCHTDLTTCCSSDQGMDRGDWYAPDSEDKLPLESEDNSKNSTYEHHGNQIVTLYRRSTAVIQSGMYRCEIAVNGSGRGTIYVGLYETGGNSLMFVLFTENKLMMQNIFQYFQEILRYQVFLCLWTPFSPVYPLVDLLPMSPGQEALMRII